VKQNRDTISGTADINGAQLYYEMRGTGHPLLLLHAGVADSRMWDDQFDVFADSFRVIRFDFRGFGRSNMPSGKFANFEDVRALLDFLKIKTATLLGISFGGMVALDFALAYPNYTSALILGAPSVSGTEPSERIRQFWEAEELAFDRGDIEWATELNLRLWVDGPQRSRDEVNPEVRERVRVMQTAVFMKEIPDDIEEIDLDPPAAERLDELNIPVLVMIGDLDLEEKHALADRLGRDIPDCRKIVIPGAAHMLNMEKPELFNQGALKFMSTL